MAKRGDLTLAEALELLVACEANGADLLDEAKILYSNRHFPRAYVLAQLAGEEFAKVHMLLSLVVMKTAGMDPPMKPFWDWWVDHNQKSTMQKSWDDTILHLDARSWLNEPPDVAAQTILNLVNDLAASIASAKAHAQVTSTRREDATYVDFRNSKVLIPKRRIGRGSAKQKIDEVSVEAQRASEIASAPIGKLVQLPEALDFLNTSVQGLMERLKGLPQS